MRCFIGIDLGSTTTKAVVIDENRNILGRGITNSRSNYDTAAAIAKQEALVNTRFHLFRNALSGSGALNGSLDDFLGHLERDFRLEQFLEQLADLEATCRRAAEGTRFGEHAEAVSTALTEVLLLWEAITASSRPGTPGRFSAGLCAVRARWARMASLSFKNWASCASLIGIKTMGSPPEDTMRRVSPTTV